MSETTTKPATKKVVGSKTTEILLGSASAKLSAAVVSIKDFFSKIDDMERKSEELVLEIANKENMIQSLEVIYDQKNKQMNFDLELAAKEKTAELLEEHLRATNQVLVPAKKLADLTRTSNDFNVMLSTEISKVEKDMKETLESQLSNYQHQQRADNATNLAELAQAQKEVDLYKQQIQRLEAELVAARELVEKVANAGKIGSINIPTGR